MNEPQMNDLRIPLRSGETCVLQGDMLSVGQRQVALADIASAGLVADTSVPVPPGMPPTPGVSLRLRDGGVVQFTPVEQRDCWRLLQSLAAVRPELTSPLPPPPGAYGPPPGYAPPDYSSGYSSGYAPGYPPGYGYGALAGPTDTERTLAGICHLSVFFAPVILPLIIWLAMDKSQPYASRQAKQAFFFHLGYTVFTIIVVVAVQAYYLTNIFTLIGQSSATTPSTVNLSFLPLVFAGYGLIGVVALIEIIFSIFGAVQAFQGKPFHYPLLGGLG